MKKLPDERKKDLLNAAVMLFRKKGVDRTSVSDIVREAHVAQGTFYNYYQSKDDIYAAVLEQATEDIIEDIRETAGRTDLDSVQKLNLIVVQDFNLNRKNDSLFDVLHESRYADAHQKYVVSRIQKLRPIYAELIRCGIREGLMETPYPDEAALFFLTAVKFVFDPAFFSYSAEEMLKMSEAAENFSERILGTKPGVLSNPEMEKGILNYCRRVQNESGI